MMATQSIRLVLADDHPIVLTGLQHLFETEPGFSVLARCGDGEQTLQAVRTHRPDVLILDIRMPKKDGLEVLREIGREALPTRAVLLTAAPDEETILEAVRLGVRGVVLKEMAPELLIKCVREVHDGELWLEKRFAGRALERMLLLQGAARNLVPLLTSREIEVVQLAAGGLHNKAIAKKLFISDGTVNNHLHKIYDKLQLGGRLELMLYAYEKGLVWTPSTRPALRAGSVGRGLGREGEAQPGRPAKKI